jgi:hypothetical protein
MTQEMERCALEIRQCWQECDTALGVGDSEAANDAFGRAFETVDGFPAIAGPDLQTLRFLCVLTWVKVAATLESTGQDDAAVEARQQVFTLLDEEFAAPETGIGQSWTSLEFARGLESEESTDLVGRLYLLCSKSGRKDALLWGRCFMEFDLKVHGEKPPAIN